MSRRFIERTGYYLDKENFSSVSLEQLWNRLEQFIKSRSNKFKDIFISKNEHKITVIPDDLRHIDESIIFDRKERSLSTKIAKITHLSLQFDPSSGKLVLSNMNSSLDGSFTNSIYYQPMCSAPNLANKNSLFFHETSLVNYANNFIVKEYVESKKYVAMISFTTDSITMKPNGDLIDGKDFTNDDFRDESYQRNDRLFVIYDTINCKISALTAGNEHIDSSFVDILTSDFNIQSVSSDFTIETTQNNNTVRVRYYDFQMAKSNIKMYHKTDEENENDWFDFLTFNAVIFRRFEDSLKSSLSSISSFYPLHN